jgi:hypothetical protein
MNSYLIRYIQSGKVYSMTIIAQNMHAVILELANEYNIPEKNVLAINKLEE